MAAAIWPVTTHIACHNLTWLHGMRFCNPQRSICSTPAFFYAPIRNFSIGIPQKHAVPALPVNSFITVYCVYSVIYWTPVIFEHSVIVTGVHTAGISITTDAVQSHRTKSVATEELQWWARAANGRRLHTCEGALAVLANLWWRTGRIFEGALISVDTALIWRPVITLVAAGSVTAEFCAVAADTITHKAIFTETRDGLAGKAVTSFLQLQAGGIIVTGITAGNKFSCTKYRTSLLHNTGFSGDWIKIKPWFYYTDPSVFLH